MSCCSFSINRLNRRRRKPSINGYYNAIRKPGSIQKQPHESSDQVVRLAIPAHRRVLDELFGSGQQLSRLLKSIVGSLGLAGLVVSHSPIPNYSNSLKTQLLLRPLPMSILWHEVRSCQADVLVHTMQDNLHALVIVGYPFIVYLPTLHHLNENGKNMESRNRGGTAVKAS